MTDHLEQGHGKIIFWLLTIMLLVGAGILITPFVPALLWATVLSVLFYPMFKRSQERFKKRKSGDTMAACSRGSLCLPGTAWENIRQLSENRPTLLFGSSFGHSSSGASDQ